VVDGSRELFYVLHRATDQSARLTDLLCGSGSGLLCAFRGAIDLAVSADHPVSGLLYLLELVRLVCNTFADIFQVAGHIGQLNTQRADAAGQLRDETLAPQEIALESDNELLCSS
jgi:hypothetical protein